MNWTIRHQKQNDSSFMVILARAKTYLKRVSTLDLRSLALFRICLAGVVILDLLNRLPDIETFYTDSGLLPRVQFLSQFDLGRFAVFPLLNGTTWFQSLLFAIYFISALAMLLGFRTRLSTFVTWIFCLSWQSRLPEVVYCGDVLMRMLLLWGVFLPLGASFSMDELFSGKKERISYRYVSPASLGLILQIAFVYLVAAITKERSVAWRGGTGLYSALSADPYVTAIGAWLSTKKSLLVVSNYGVMAFEFFAPMALFLPWKNNRVRLPIFLLFFCFHLSMGAGLCVWLFQVIAIAGWTSLIPASFWVRLHQKYKWEKSRIWPVLERFSHRLHKIFGIEKKVLIGRPSQAIYGLSLILVAMIVYWNASVARPRSIPIPPGFRKVAYAVGVDQTWNMFSEPFKKTGWFVFPAKLSGGAEVDLMKHGAPVEWKKPERVNSLFRNERWRKYMLNLLSDRDTNDRMNYGRYLCRSWNTIHTKPEEKLEAFNMVYLSQAILPDGARGQLTNTVLWKHECFDGMLSKWGSRLPSGEFR